MNRRFRTNKLLTSLLNVLKHWPSPQQPLVNYLYENPHFDLLVSRLNNPLQDKYTLLLAHGVVVGESNIHSHFTSLLFMHFRGLSFNLHYFPLPRKGNFVYLFYHSFFISPPFYYVFIFPYFFSSVLCSTQKGKATHPDGWMSPIKRCLIRRTRDTLWLLTVFRLT